MSPSVHSILEQVKVLPPDEQVELAEAVDHLTWARRWRAVCERIEAKPCRRSALADEEIDARVRAIRQETPLSERSSTPRS